MKCPQNYWDDGCTTVNILITTEWHTFSKDELGCVYSVSTKLLETKREGEKEKKREEMIGEILAGHDHNSLRQEFKRILSVNKNYASRC